EIANRLQQLRKNNNLSQEELAEKIGVSRQAVSKWERAEASPDTDNLILLSRLYNMSLDELLRTDSRPVGGVSLKKDDYREPAREMRPDNYTDEEIYPNRETTHNSIPQGSPFGADISEEEKRKASHDGEFGEFGEAMNRAGRAIGDALNAAGDRVREEMKRTGKDGKSFEDRLERSMTKIGNGIERAGRAVERSFDKIGEKMEEKEKRYANMYGYESSSADNSSKKRKHKNKKGQNPPATLFDKLFCFLVLGVFFSCVGVGLAHPGWVLFLLIPFYYTTKNALRKRNLLLFCYPLLCAIIYFGIGGFLDTIFWGSLAVYWYEV
ncbi:MAG: helix-turn-helix transcriptional regulator, partial [Oscillospiraceae bacterium]|nr:helix-turn-helix transcriptional regulator [Oscillospiraceae bacterium]